MKKHFLIALGVCLASMLPASAQINNGLRVTLPQTVMVGQTQLPAGTYFIQEVSDDGNASILTIRSESHGPSIEVLATRIEEANGHGAQHSSVTLKPISGKLQLDKIWIEGQVSGYELNTAH